MGTWAAGLTDNDTSQDILLDVANGGLSAFRSVVGECVAGLPAGYDEVSVNICSAVAVLFMAAHGVDYGPSVEETLETRGFLGFGATLGSKIASDADPQMMHQIGEGIVAYAMGPTLAELGASDAFIAAYRANAARLRDQIGMQQP